jgi:hypothetical protein
VQLVNSIRLDIFVLKSDDNEDGWSKVEYGRLFFFSGFAPERGESVKSNNKQQKGECQRESSPNLKSPPIINTRQNTNLPDSMTTADTAKQVHRTTLFKIPDTNNIQPILDKYSTLAQDAKKVHTHTHTLHVIIFFFSNLWSKKNGKPYILRCVAGPVVNDPRSQGYTLAAQTTFGSLEDMKYYDEECEAHAALKAVAKGKVEAPPLMVCFDHAISSTSSSSSSS